MGLRIMLKDFAFEDPHFHTDDAIGRHRFRQGIVDVGPQRVQLSNQATPPRTVMLVSDGLRPFAVEAGAAP